MKLLSRNTIFLSLLLLQTFTPKNLYPYSLAHVIPFSKRVKVSHEMVRICIQQIQKTNPKMSYPREFEIAQYRAPEKLTAHVYKECIRMKRTYTYLKMLRTFESRHSWITGVKMLTREKSWFSLTAVLSHPIMEIRLLASKALLESKNRSIAPYVLNVLEHNSFHLFKPLPTALNLEFQRNLIVILSNLTGKYVKNYRLPIEVSIRYGIEEWLVKLLSSVKGK